MRLFLVALALFASNAFAQLRVEVDLPSIVFPAPPTLVVIEPGVQVVRDFDDEVFRADGWYWHRRGPHWYRTRTHTGGWARVDVALVPTTIVRYEPGRYRRWRGDGERGPAPEHGHGKKRGHR